MIDRTNTRIMSAGLMALALTIYAIALFGGQFMPDANPVASTNLTFNSMAEHLLAGRFDVDPAIVGNEGFVVKGSVVAYWGIWPALLRLPLVLIAGGQRWDVTALSCLVAVCLAAAIKIKTCRMIFRHFERAGKIGVTTFRLLYWSVVLTILFSGPQIEFLKPNIYQEVCLWAGAFAAIFGYWAVAGLLHGRFAISRLCAMATVSGLALLTRVSTGVGLYAACCLLVATLAAARPSYDLRRLALPLSILIVFAGIVGFVNFERWGNPLTFADYHLYLSNIEHPEWLDKLANYGLFNLVRIPIGLSYYFVPILFLPSSAAHLIQSEQLRLLDFAELPPSSFILTDPLLLGMMLCGCQTIFKRRHRFAVDGTQTLSIALGLCASGLLMLCAISMSHRYRIDFYPLVEFLAFIGLIRVLNREVPVGRAAGISIVGAAVTSIASSSIVLVLYRLSWWLPGLPLLRASVLAYYEHRFEWLLSRLFAH